MLLKTYEKFATTTPETSIGTYLKESDRLALNVYVVPSVKNEVHAKLKEKSDEHAIKVFSENVRRVLLGSPYGPKCVLGVDVLRAVGQVVQRQQNLGALLRARKGGVWGKEPKPFTDRRLIRLIRV